MPTTARQRTNGSAPPAAEKRIERRANATPVVTRGAVSIAESVVEKVAATAARTVRGIYPAGDVKGLANGLARAVGAKGGSGTEGIRARIRGNHEVSLEMRMAVDYGEHMPSRGQEVRFVVAKAIREMTDLEAREIKVKITEVLLRESDSANGGSKSE